MLFNIMGASIIRVWAATLALALVLARQRLADRVLTAGLGWGLGVSLLGMILAVLMINPINQRVQRLSHGPPPLLDGGHTVGGVDGGPGLPVTNWSLHAGDLRAPHFVGIHALQLLPLFAWLLGRGRQLGGGQQVRLVHLAGLGYLGVVVFLAWQALSGEPVTQPGAATLTAAGLLLPAAGTAAAVTIGTRHRPRPHPERAPGPGTPQPTELGPSPAGPGRRQR